MRTLCGCVVVCSVLLSSFLGSAAWSQSGTSEPPGLDEIIAAANSYVQASPSWTPAEAPEGAGPESDEGGNSDVLDPEASVLPDAATGEAVPFDLNDSVYSGSISTTILDIFAGVCSKYPSKDYVAFRSGQYTYDLYIGARSFFMLFMILHRTTTMAHISGTIARIWALRRGHL